MRTNCVVALEECHIGHVQNNSRYRLRAFSHPNITLHNVQQDDQSLQISRFLTFFKDAFTKGTFIKCTLSKPGAKAPQDLKNVYLRPVELKQGLKIAFNFRYKTRDEVKNFDLELGAAYLQTLLGEVFLNADFFSTTQDLTLGFDKKGAITLLMKKPTHAREVEMTHDRTKQRLLDPATPWLHRLGITSAKGEVLAASQDKWKQINKFLEIIASVIKTDALPADLHIADMGSGKGYLTFALYDYLSNKLGLEPHITGIELRQNLVDFCNQLAKEANFTRLEFIAQDINKYNPARLDMLIALHACDTATDLALAKGILGQAKAIVVAPCCHKQIRKAMHTSNELEPVLRFGILEERQAEIITDGIRALLLEAEGYKTNVFEFISTEHTAKNVMITAVADARNKHQRTQALAKVAALKSGFGIAQHYLEGLLAGKVAGLPEN